MKASRFTSIFTEAVALAYAVLFLYAAASKLLDFENFRLQLGQSPLLSAFADRIAVLVPVTEILAALLLLILPTRLAGFFISYSLMMMFTTYIYIIINFSAFVPCSCGGILEEMGWGEHLVFNIVFLLLAAAGIIFHTRNNTQQFQP
jgi:uncharacterized membrane protein YphA (DoxX/SURF4 family)